jgi:hypothetical protein
MRKFEILQKWVTANQRFNVQLAGRDDNHI